MNGKMKILSLKKVDILQVLRITILQCNVSRQGKILRGSSLSSLSFEVSCATCKVSGRRRVRFPSGQLRRFTR